MPDQKTALIVDDDPDVRESVSRRLQWLGYSTRVATNGREALADVAARRPDVVILDIRMPELDGMTVLSELRKSAEHREIPVIMLSASAVDKKRAFAAGAQLFLSKPYRGADLVAAVAAVGQSTSHRSATDQNS